MKKLLNDRAYEGLIPGAIAVIIVFAIIFIGSFVAGEIHNSLEDTLSSADKIEASSMYRMDNVSDNFDSSIDIVQVVVIITILAMAIGAIFMFTRFGRA